MNKRVITKIAVTDTDAMPWEVVSHECLKDNHFGKRLISDSDTETNMMINIVLYPAGFIVPWHYHSCSHGIYILEGTLATHQGNYGPGTFLWFPANELMQHSATPDSDVKFIFITDKKCDISFVEPN